MNPEFPIPTLCDFAEPHIAALFYFAVGSEHARSQSLNVAGNYRAFVRCVVSTSVLFMIIIPTYPFATKVRRK